MAKTVGRECVLDVVNILDSKGIGHADNHQSALLQLIKNMFDTLGSTNSLADFTVELIKERTAGLLKYKELIQFLQNITADTPMYCDKATTAKLTSVLEAKHTEWYNREAPLSVGQVEYEAYGFKKMCPRVFPVEGGCYVVCSTDFEKFSSEMVVWVYWYSKSGAADLQPLATYFIQNELYSQIKQYYSVTTNLDMSAQDYGDYLRYLFGTDEPVLSSLTSHTQFRPSFNCMYSRSKSRLPKMKIPEGYTIDSYLEELSDPLSSLHFNLTLMGEVKDTLVNFMLCTMYTTEKVNKVHTAFGLTS